MFHDLHLKKEITGNLENTIAKVTEKLKAQGFGVLSRIDLHTKIKEKTNHELPPTVILGACNPELAYQAYIQNPDVTGLLPCNATIRDTGGGKVSVELVKPTSLMKILDDEKLVTLSREADKKLEAVMESL